MDRKLLIDLYNIRNLSMAEIAKELKTSHAKVYYWFKKFDIKRRSRSECSYVKQNPNGNPFEIKKELTSKEKQLLLMGLMIYWAEGNKKNKYLVGLGNLDSRMIKLFLEFLRTICRIDETRIRLYVRVYKKFDKQKASMYWESFLKLPKSQIRVHTHTDKRSKPGKQWSRNGIAALQVGSIKLKQWLDFAIEESVSTVIKD